MLHNLPMLQNEIKTFLPHRDPMLFIDRVLELEENDIVIESKVKADANYFKGHFPNMPVMPGVLLVETLAQAGALLVSITRGLEEGKFIAFSSIDAAKFKKPVYPNEMLRVAVKIEKIRLPFYKFSGKVFRDDILVASAAFSAAQMQFEKP
ncbi:MAG: 3-hydroxyacyl-ACP dehydratase FabZ [Maricaulaceae bacterium]